MWLIITFLKIFLRYIVLYIIVIVGVAFFALLERKILSRSRIRVGPQYVGYWGLLQRFSDAIKLLTKESWRPLFGSFFVFYAAPILNIILILFLWLLYPLREGGIFWRFCLLFFIVIRGLNVYPILRAGWSSNCKYSILGRLRRVAQIVSYEIRLILVLLRIIWIIGSFNFKGIIIYQTIIYNIFLFLPLFIIWFITCLAETNRTPYDFSEGESELVSGFNTEFRGGGFTLIFLAEYARIIFIRLIRSLIFFSSNRSLRFFIKTIFIGYWFIWVRARLPRYRYDKLINLAWKSLLPLTLGFFIFYIRLNYFFEV